MLDFYSIFKPAKSESRWWNLLKTGLQTSVFWLVFLYLIPMGLRHIETLLKITTFQPINQLGWLMFIMFSLLGLWSGYTMSWDGKGTPLPIDCPNDLVVSGPYRFLRNPMATAGISQGICIGLIMGSYLIIVYSLSGAAIWHYLVRPSEEIDLKERFGEKYRIYKKNTRCWIPKFNKLK